MKIKFDWKCTVGSVIRQNIYTLKCKNTSKKKKLVEIKIAASKWMISNGFSGSILHVEIINDK